MAQLKHILFRDTDNCDFLSYKSDKKHIIQEKHFPLGATGGDCIGRNKVASSIFISDDFMNFHFMLINNLLTLFIFHMKCWSTM